MRVRTVLPVGAKFGTLTVSGSVPVTEGRSKSFVTCNCGNTREVFCRDLTRGNVVTCGVKQNHLIEQCWRGHLYDETNTRYDIDGGRSCRTCQRESKREKAKLKPRKRKPNAITPPPFCKHGHEMTPENTYIAGGKKPRWHCKACQKEQKKQYRSSPSGRKTEAMYNAEYGLKRYYGITLKEKQAMFDAQGRKCACCESTDSRSHPKFKGMSAWHVDHDHTMGKVRSILCRICNSVVGYLRENPNHADAVAVYIRKYCLHEDDIDTRCVGGC